MRDDEVNGFEEDFLHFVGGFGVDVVVVVGVDLEVYDLGLAGLEGIGKGDALAVFNGEVSGAAVELGGYLALLGDEEDGGGIGKVFLLEVAEVGDALRVLGPGGDGGGGEVVNA